MESSIHLKIGLNPKMDSANQITQHPHKYYGVSGSALVWTLISTWLQLTAGNTFNSVILNS